MMTCMITWKLSLEIILNSPKDMEMKSVIKILIVEDDAFYMQTVKKHLKNLEKTRFLEHKFEIKTSKAADDCMEKLEKDTDIVIMDYYLENDEGQVLFPGTYLLRAINLYCDNCRVIVLSGQKSQVVTKKLIKMGIYDYIIKDNHALEQLTTDIELIMTIKAHNELA